MEGVIDIKPDMTVTFMDLLPPDCIWFVFSRSPKAALKIRLGKSPDAGTDEEIPGNDPKETLRKHPQTHEDVVTSLSAPALDSIVVTSLFGVELLHRLS